jgi:hypothetical protein
LTLQNSRLSSSGFLADAYISPDHQKHFSSVSWDRPSHFYWIAFIAIDIAQFTQSNFEVKSTWSAAHDTDQIIYLSMAEATIAREGTLVFRNRDNVGDRDITDDLDITETNTKMPCPPKSSL